MTKAPTDADALIAELQAMIDNAPNMHENSLLVVFSEHNLARAREIGECLHGAGGDPLMQMAIQSLSTSSEVDLWELDRVWDGIGGWETQWKERVVTLVAKLFFKYLAREAVKEGLLIQEDVDATRRTHDSWEVRFLALQAMCERVLAESSEPAAYVRDYITLKLFREDGP